MPDGQVAVLERLLDAHTLARVESEHAIEQVQRIGVGARKELLERHFAHVRQVADVFLCSWRSDTREGGLGRRAKEVQDLVQLVDVVSALEERLAAEEFGEDAADGPHIDCLSGQHEVHHECSLIRTSFSVALEAQHDFRRSVPPRGDILSHVSSILLWVYAEASRQAKIGNLELAVGVHQKVARLQVTVKYVGAVDVLKTAQYLVDERLEVGVGERLARTDDRC